MRHRVERGFKHINTLQECVSVFVHFYFCPSKSSAFSRLLLLWNMLDHYHTVSHTIGIWHSSSSVNNSFIDIFSAK